MFTTRGCQKLKYTATPLIPDKDDHWTLPDLTGGQGFSGVTCQNLWGGGRKEGPTTEFVSSGNSQSKVFRIKETLTARTNLKWVILFTGYTITLLFSFI